MLVFNWRKLWTWLSFFSFIFQIPNSDLAKLLLHKIPIEVPTQELQTLFSREYNVIIEVFIYSCFTFSWNIGDWMLYLLSIIMCYPFAVCYKASRWKLFNICCFQKFYRGRWSIQKNRRSSEEGMCQNLLISEVFCFLVYTFKGSHCWNIVITAALAQYTCSKLCTCSRIAARHVLALGETCGARKVGMYHVNLCMLI